MLTFLKKLLLGESSDNRPVKPGALKRQRHNLKKVWNNEQHNDIGVERVFRLLLLSSLYTFPGLYIREYFGRKGADAKNLAIEVYVLFKLWLPVVLLLTGWYHHKIAIYLVSYLLLETVVYLTSLIFLADVYPKLRSIRRSFFLLFLNYLEIAFDYSVIYASLDLLKGKAHSVFDHVYFSIITSATVGYGDIYPTTTLGKVLSCTQAILFLIFVVLFLNFFGSKIDAIGYTDHEK